MNTSSFNKVVRDEALIEDDGLLALAYAARNFNLLVDAKSLKHRIGASKERVSDYKDICRCAKWIGLRARHIITSIERLEHIAFPVLLDTEQGWLVLTKVDGDSFVLYHPLLKLEKRYVRKELVEQWDGRGILLAEKTFEYKNKKFGFGWFFPSIIKHATQFRNIIIVSLVIQLIALTTPMLFENVIDRVLVSRSLSNLQVLGFAMLALAISEPIYSFLRSILYSNLASKVNSELSSKIYQHLLSLPLNYFRDRQTGEVIARVREMNQIQQFLTGSALTLVLDLAFVGVFIAVMFFYSPALTWLVLGALLLYFIFWIVFGPVLRSRVVKEYELKAGNTAFLTESITGIETIKTCAVEKDFSLRWEQRLSTFVRASFRARVVGILAGQGIGLIQKLTSALILWWGAIMVMNGKISMGELVAFNMFSDHVTQPILRLAQVWQDFQHSLISVKRLGDILDEKGESSRSSLTSIPELKGSIRFEGVFFRYNERESDVLRNLDIDINPGEFIGITGVSGSGKSTLTRLLQGVYIPQHGKVLVDNIDLAIIEPSELRRRMSIVLQDSVLFSGSIAENIRQCLPLASDGEVVRASILAGADEFIRKLPNGYDTQVGERGGLLSGGQRQRIALARALLTNPRILILDEATSALDYESEAAVMSNLQQIVKGRTVISVAHRLSTLRHADRILLLDKGGVIEQGRHEELLAAGGKYAQLWNIQMSEV
ncbi:type I secretion system permease/ATPase [Serratia ureilytica]|uniref:type I secretion system permease/ATPase n=1 Tax=Serratia ureilytica TaxID=300181 RepID=UPI003D36DB86